MMTRNLLSILFLCTPLLVSAQINYTANEQVPEYNASFKLGVNPGYHGSQWDDEKLADLSAGDATQNIPGVGVSTWRFPLKSYFLENWGYDNKLDEMEYYQSLGMGEHTIFVGYPASEVRDTTFFCPNHQSELFDNLYTPIWDGGANGTPYNDDNYYAAYLYKTVDLYKDHVRFWEVWNEPDFDRSNNAWREPGSEGNWYENTPEPCDMDIRAPIYHYIRMLRISYEIIKTVDPTAYVAIGGIGYSSFLDLVLRHTDNPVDGSVSSDYPLLGGAYFDVLSYHVYPHINGSLREWNSNTSSWDYYRHSDAAVQSVLDVQTKFKSILQTYGYNGQTYPEKLWIITEANIPRTPFDDHIGSTEAQRNFILKAQVACIQNKIHQFHVFQLADKKTSVEAEDGFDLMGFYKNFKEIDPGEEEILESGIAAKTFSQLTENTNYDPDQTALLDLTDNLRGAAFLQADGQYTYVLWALTEIDQTETANATYQFPVELDIQQLEKKAWDFSQTATQTIIAPTNVALTGTPFFFTEKNTTAAQNLGNHFDIQLSPNPFSTNSFINFSLQKQSNIQIDLLNIHGQKLKTVMSNQVKPEGKYSIELNGKELSTGIYFAQVMINDQVFSLKMVKFQ